MVILNMKKNLISLGAFDSISNDAMLDDGTTKNLRIYTIVDLFISHMSWEKLEIFYKRHLFEAIKAEKLNFHKECVRGKQDHL